MTSALACLLAAALLLAACGGDSGPGGGGNGGTASSRPAPPRSAFPAPEGRTLKEVINDTAEAHSELVISPAALAFHEGENRYPFGVFKADRTPIDDAEVALYMSKVPDPEEIAETAAPERGNGARRKGALAKARGKALEQPAVGPFPARVETLATKPAFRAKTTTDDPDAANVVYSTQLDFPTEGEWRIAALVDNDGEMQATILPSANIGEFKSLPEVGEKAPAIHTPTVGDVGGDPSKVTTRVPPDTQNRVDYADVLGREPIVLLFATPQFCQSRVCGPVVDVAEQVQAEYGDEAAFIHMEIYKGNDPNNPTRPQVQAFRLPTEPWLFAIDRQGVIREEIEGAFGVDLLTRTVKEVVAE